MRRTFCTITQTDGTIQTYSVYRVNVGRFGLVDLNASTTQYVGGLTTARRPSEAPYAQLEDHASTDECPPYHHPVNGGQP